MPYEDESGEVFIDPEDQCASCRYATNPKGVTCPLVASLYLGHVVINPEYDLRVEDCPMYWPMLTIVKDPQDD